MEKEKDRKNNWKYKQNEEEGRRGKVARSEEENNKENKLVFLLFRNSLISDGFDVVTKSYSSLQLAYFISRAHISNSLGNHLLNKVFSEVR